MSQILPATSWTVVVPEKKVAASDVFIGCMPLVVPAFAPPLLAPTLAQFGMRHFYTLVRTPLPAPTCLYFDFLPEHPENPLVMTAALMGQRVPGVVRERRLEKVPKRNCWWVGKTAPLKGLGSAKEFNRDWDPQLSLFRHDCRHHTDSLVEHLTGKRDLISQLDVLRKLNQYDHSFQKLDEN